MTSLLRTKRGQGTAAWTFVSISQYILDIRPIFDGLLIDPCIPSTMNSFTVTRNFKNAIYNITVENSSGVEKGVKSIILDGKPLEGAVLPALRDGKTYEVVVKMG